MANATDLMEAGPTPRRERVFAAINKASGLARRAGSLLATFRS